MVKLIIAGVFLAVVLVAAGIAFSACFGSQASDGTSVAQEGTPVPTPIPRQSAPDVAPTPPPSPGPTASPAPTLEPGVCPPPVRVTPADFAKPPPVRPASELPGWRVQGGATFKQGYLNLYLPAARQFIIATGSGDRGNVSMMLYDVEAHSSLVIRGDGCEKERFVRDPAVDVVFDEILATLEVGSTYVCLPASRSVLAPEEIPPDPSRLGQRVTGGSPEAERLGLHLPPGREFVVWQGLADPGGGFTGIYDIAARSFLFLAADGCEMSRRITDPEADSVFDEIVGAQQVPTRGALGCVDCPVKAGDQLKVTVEDIQLGKDGKYYVPDRGDGCSYREVEWGPLRGAGGVTLSDPDCEVFWTYLPGTGEVQPWTP